MKSPIHLQVEEGISNWILGIIVLSCASPAITLNVWPRVDAILQHGISSNQIGIVLLVTLSALGMTCVPFAMKKAENLGFWLTCLLFGIGLGILNYTMAVGAVGKSRDEEAGSKAMVISKAASLRSSILEAETAKRNLPPFKWTSEEMVRTALAAVDLAREARDQECGKVGDICRARVAQLGNRQADLAALASDRAATERAENLGKDIQAKRELLSSLGPIPESVDQQASRIASALGTFFPLGRNASETVATGLIHFLAICAEAFALGMPRIIVTALAKKNPPNAQNNPIPNNPVVSRPPADTTRSNNSISRAPSRPKQATALSNNSKSTYSVSEWKSTFLIRSTSKTRDWEAYESYKKEAKEKTLSIVSFIIFDKELQTLGVVKTNDPVLKRDFYLDVAIKTTLKAVS